jgi:organic radical activating enzyme
MDARSTVTAKEGDRYPLGPPYIVNRNFKTITMIDMKNDKFCPLPWTSIYHQLGNNSPCHCVRGIPSMPPMQYLESDELRHMKENFLNNKFTSHCTMCESREQMGIKSTRREVIKWFNKRTETKYSMDDKFSIRRLELRFSNLCNFKCRMCEPYSSSEIARELKKYETFQLAIDDPVIRSSDQQIEELKKIAHNINVLCLTGGEPFLIKEYYDFMDYLVEKDLAKNIMIEVFTNCSTYNEKFISKLLQFRQVRFVVSIDGVDQTAEYIRHGTKWETVRENILRFAKLPFDFHYNTAISQYTLLDVENLAKFLMEVYEVNKGIQTKCYAVIAPSELHFLNMPKHHRPRVYEQIDKAVEILNVSNFDILTNELLDLKRNLQENPEPVDLMAYVEFTEKLDKRRNENFKDVFGISLR